MSPSASVPIPYRIIALMQERNRLFEYPLDLLADGIKATGFRCTGCGACCTRSINNHIFLLDRDVSELKKVDPSAFEPAPDPEFCDQTGTLYVSGYALRMKNDPAGSCWFLEDNRCRIYDRRFSICRIYPHILRRITDAHGTAAWQQFIRPGGHGFYPHNLSEDECFCLAREIKEYENAFLTQQLLFLETVHEYFTIQRLRHDRNMFALQIRRVARGKPVPIKVFYDGELEELTTHGVNLRSDDPFQLLRPHDPRVQDHCGGGRIHG